MCKIMSMATVHWMYIWYVHFILTAVFLCFNSQYVYITLNLTQCYDYLPKSSVMATLEGKYFDLCWEIVWFRRLNWIVLDWLLLESDCLASFCKAVPLYFPCILYTFCIAMWLNISSMCANGLCHFDVLLIFFFILIIFNIRILLHT